jgi:uncharacterized protein
MYALGKGVEQDDREAVKWFRLSAEQGDPTAQTMLGAMYEWGRGVTQDYGEAMNWLRAASDQGDRDAQFALGLVYFKAQWLLICPRSTFWWSKLTGCNRRRSRAGRRDRDRR